MNTIAQKLLLAIAQKLGPERLGKARCDEHLRRITSFLMSKRKKPTNPEELEELIDNLVNVALWGITSQERKKSKIAKLRKPFSGSNKPLQTEKDLRLGTSQGTTTALKLTNSIDHKHVESNVTFVLLNVYEGLFEGVKISQDNKRTLRAKLKPFIIRKILQDRKNNKTFEKAFLDSDNINTIFYTLQNILKEKCNDQNTALTVDDTFVKAVVIALAEKLKKEKHQTTGISH